MQISKFRTCSGLSKWKKQQHDNLMQLDELLISVTRWESPKMVGKGILSDLITVRNPMNWSWLVHEKHFQKFHFCDDSWSIAGSRPLLLTQDSTKVKICWDMSTWKQDEMQVLLLCCSHLITFTLTPQGFTTWYFECIFYFVELAVIQSHKLWVYYGYYY